MKRRKGIESSGWAPLMLALAFAASPALAQHAGGGGHVGGGGGGGHFSGGGHAVGAGAHQHFDAAYGHNQYYYNRGYRSFTAPHGGYAVNYNGGRYWYGNGHWWHWWGGGWIVVGAPYGAFVPFLPPFYTTVWWDGAPYYYANDTYYLWSDTDHEYQVVQPPDGIQAATPQGAEQGAPSGEPFVYPKNGQTPEQIATDRYECHRWAADQTGFDPTQTAGGVAPEAADMKRADYLRAQAACLEGRGYTVK